MNWTKPRLDKPDRARLACLSLILNWPSTISRVSFTWSRNWSRIQCWRSVRGSLLSGLADGESSRRWDISASGFRVMAESTGAELLTARSRMALSLSVFQAFYQTGDHFGDLLQVDFELLMDFRRDEIPPAGQFEKGNAFLYAASGDAEEVLSVAFRESAVAFGDVGGNGQRRSIELVGKEIKAPRETTRDLRDSIGEIYGLLVDDELFKGERHGWFPFRGLTATVRLEATVRSTATARLTATAELTAESRK